MNHDEWQALWGTTPWFHCMQGEITWPTPYFPPVKRLVNFFLILPLENKSTTKIVGIRGFGLK